MTRNCRIPGCDRTLDPRNRTDLCFTHAAADRAVRMRGVKLSDETRAKMSASKLGKARPAEVVAKCAATRRGKPYGRLAALTPQQRADYDAYRHAGYRASEALKAIGRSDLIAGESAP